VRLYGVAFLGRARSSAAASAKEVDRLSLAAMIVLAGLCLLTGILPGYVIDALAPVTASVVGARMPQQSAVSWLSIVPIGQSRSSYNGLLVFAFIAFCSAAGAYVIHRLASRTLRRAPIWDGGFPDPNPAIQYTASSFAQPIRRVFGQIVFRTSDAVDMPPPGDLRPARFVATVHDLVWEGLYAPLTNAVNRVADRLNRYQFLTIRQYLSVVFIALVSLLSLVALWP
jgi:NADH:ubiquinone oxidoreductase subunit 5 (subunit L)/multisubunit Na+/H+ antiporter MnhA subunit